MAARPPTGGTEEPEAIEFGIAALDVRLDDAGVEFPATGEAVVDALDDPAIPYDASGRSVRLAVVLEHVQMDRFETRSELMNELHPVFEERRRNKGGTLLSWVRALLPF